MLVLHVSLLLHLISFFRKWSWLNVFFIYLWCCFSLKLIVPGGLYSRLSILWSFLAGSLLPWIHYKRNNVPPLKSGLKGHVPWLSHGVLLFASQSLGAEIVALFEERYLYKIQGCCGAVMLSTYHEVSRF